MTFSNPASVEAAYERTPPFPTELLQANHPEKHHDR